MTHKKRADQQISPKKTQVHDTSTAAQRDRLLAWLNQGPIDTFTARTELNILAPAARISELRDMGHAIKTQRITLTDDQGRTHLGIALYFLSSEETAND